MDGIGNIFKSNRIKKNLTLADVEQATKIRSKYLQAIEEEHFDVIPGKVYLKGFIKSYAKLLAIEDNEEINTFLEDNKTLAFEIEMDKAFEQKDEIPKGIQKKHISIILGLFAILILFGVQNLYHKYFEEQVVIPPPPTISDKEIPPIIEKPPVSGETDVDLLPQNNQLIIEILDITSAKDACWVQVYSDNSKIYEGIMYEGEQKTIEAKEKIKIKLGNAGVVKLTLGETDLDIPGKIGHVWEKEFILSDSL